MGTNLARSQDEIVARIERLRENDRDPFGWSREVLIGYLDYEHAQPYLQDGVTEKDWAEAIAEDGDWVANPIASLIDYLDFAWTKALDERGLSANRSVDKIKQWLWLAGEDGLLGQFLDAPYAMYGKPQLAVVTRALAPEKMPEVGSPE